jgi:hypothetical protein
MNRTLTIIGILILIMLGMIEVQLYNQGAALDAMWSRLDELSTQVNDLAAQGDENTDDDSSDAPGQCTGDQPRRQI